MTYRTKKKQEKRGIALLLVVVVIGSAALIMALDIALLGLGELDMGYTSQQGGETFSVADGCVEEALRRFRITSTYAGGSLSLGDGSCTIGVSSAGTNRIITATSTIGVHNSVVRMNIDIDANSVITVNSWEKL